MKSEEQEEKNPILFGLNIAFRLGKPMIRSVADQEGKIRMRPHEKLDVWRRAIDLVVRIYKMTESFPKEERFGLISQIRRAAVSIPANIAEGAARQSSKEFSHFLSNAQGSVSELATEMVIARRLGYVAENRYQADYDELTSIGRMILGLSRSVRQNRA